MSKTLYLECYSGISGDMTVAALLDLGADREVLKESLKSLPVGGFRTEITRVKKSGLDACDFSVILEQDNHDHDMEYLHGSEKSYAGHHEHSHEMNHEHHHGHTHSHEHPHEHRGMKEITEIIQKSEMTARAKKMAMRVFGILAQAESKAHGVPVEEVHFHEVGAVDSIVDIAAIAICMDNLDISNVIVPVLYEGTGFIRCQHGQIPVPVPAVTHIAETHKLKLKITDIQGELVTPTGAAVVAAFRTSDRLPEDFTMLKTGIGAGKRQYRCPGILRAMLIRETTDLQIKDIIWKLETDMDDCGGEMMGHVMNLLMANGAREVHYTPIYTKKNRPAYTLTVICKESEREKLENLIFSETTTIGIRRVEMERTILQREIQKKDTPVGTAIVKACTLPDGNIRYYPEYENVAELAERNQLSFRETYDRIRSYWTTER
ncbi:nickel pincer cofactor biosynthesis protein LarC [Blautia obeum]|uniref:Pyridinium-3,5-bisthiocarboxylic acid mononucleotide nickel insertion protein n=1 Tax=Blautia obeum TaxID=40520 RepID=A0A411ZWK9_9FIRM|nr:nickel pincer cofactor biosynthesis protein LarC [Blautia obeum]RGI92285.1 nickel pincer cofactor biosynthesis protein LarC [Blautia obeum]RGQ07210.1 nickel pincer cofactor biosynthesis protein LarC [Blautia obeum]RGY07048.1 nickel pincer cofactor biosynthesis protein LarC [Blautia obeum]